MSELLNHPDRIILIIIGTCGFLSHFFSPTSKTGKVLNIIGAFTFRAATSVKEEK
jgi:hypothetical protein